MALQESDGDIGPGPGPGVRHEDAGVMRAGRWVAAPGRVHWTVDMERPWQWLALGWRDFLRAPRVGIAYGAGVAIVGALLVQISVLAGAWILVVPLATGFMLIGPVAAVGLYETSRRLEVGLQPSLGAALGAFARNPGQLALMGFALTFLLLAWMLLASIVFMLFFGASGIGAETFFRQMFFSAATIPFLALGSALGAVLAATVFAISAVSLPMMLDRDADAFAAGTESVRTVLRHPRVMAFWGALIVLFVGTGILTLGLGLIIALPLIGHATWHAYRDLVPDGKD